MSSQRLQRRFPLEPLITWITVNFPHDADELFEVLDDDGRPTGEIRVSNERAAELLDTTRTSITVYRREGVPELAADQMAIHLGLVPRLIWPDYDDAPIDLLLTVPLSQRKAAKRCLARGLSIEHLEAAPVGRRRAS